MEELGLDGDAKAFLIGLKGRKTKELYANPTQVVLVLDDTMLDLQPSCRRVDPDHSTDEACFAGANFGHGHQEELPRSPPTATGLVLSGIWLVRTRLCFAPEVSNKLNWGRRLLGQSAKPVEREWIRHPDGQSDEKDRAESTYPVEAGVILDFGGRAIAAFCPNNDYRFAIPDSDVLQDPAEIRKRHEEHYRFDEI